MARHWFCTQESHTHGQVRRQGVPGYTCPTQNTRRLNVFLGIFSLFEVVAWISANLLCVCVFTVFTHCTRYVSISIPKPCNIPCNDRTEMEFPSLLLYFALFCGPSSFFFHIFFILPQTSKLPKFSSFWAIWCLYFNFSFSTRHTWDSVKEEGTYVLVTHYTGHFQPM